MSISNIPPNAFTAIAALLGFVIANELDNNEQNSIGNFFEALGQIILTISAQAQLQQSEEDCNNQIMHQIEMLKKQIELLELQIKK